MNYKEKVIALLNSQELSNEQKEKLEGIFPELKESEDEQIRKELIQYFSTFTLETFAGLSPKKIIAWLEKQEGCEYVKKDWLEHIKQSWYKEGFIDGKYTPKELTINDAATLNELIDFLENGTAKLQHDLTIYANWLKTQFSINEKQGEHKSQGKSALEAVNEEKVDNQNCVKSTDKVKPKFKVGDVIRLKGTAATYTIKRVTDTKYYTNRWSCGIERCEEDYELVKQKPAWSEEDEIHYCKCLQYLESISPRKEDVDWLKSLKDRYAWKPNDEQIYWLKLAANRMPDTEKANEAEAVLEELLEQLKKLKS